MDVIAKMQKYHISIKAGDFGGFCNKKTWPEQENG